MGMLERIRSFLPSAARSAEGEYRPGPYPTMLGWLPAGAPWNAWQLAIDPKPYSETTAMVEACIAAYAQTVAMCPGSHWETLPNGGRERVTGSALTRMLRQPNDYETISDFLLNLVWSLYGTGNAYVLAIENNRFEAQSLHLMRSDECFPRVADDGSLFYSLGGNPVIDRLYSKKALAAVPARYVMHIKLHRNRQNPLLGLSPIIAAACDVAASGAMSAQALAFFQNASKPSGVLKTPQVLKAEQANALREAWKAQTTGINAGGVPILTAGLEWQEVGQSNADAQLAELMKMSDQNIALAFRVPLAVLGVGSQLQSSTEALMGQWIASGLGFALNHIEEAFGTFFGLKGQPDEYLEFDTTALLRSNFKDRIEGIVRGVQGSIYSPDEARALEGLPKVPGGHGKEPRAQQQLVPLSAADAIPAAPPAPGAPPAPAGNDNADSADSKPDPAKAAAFLEKIEQSARHYARI